MDSLLGNNEWDIHHGDCIPHMAEMPPNSIDFSVYSVPFPSMFAYTDSPADMGNVESINDEVKINFAFFFKQLIRVTKPGRATVVHCMDIPRMKRSGEEGLADFPGILLRLAERAGFIWEYRWAIRKNPQAQAIRTRSRELQFAGLESDRSRQRGALPDVLLKFRKPGVNAVAIDTEGQVSRNDWIAWAEHCWDDIDQNDTLNIAEGRSEKDTKHICPLQIEVIRRLILLYSNPGEIVFSPFTGIGSEGYTALGGQSPKTKKRIHDPRRFYGTELKPSYFDAAKLNLARAVESRVNAKGTKSLF